MFLVLAPPHRLAWHTPINPTPELLSDGARIRPANEGGIAGAAGAGIWREPAPMR